VSEPASEFFHKYFPDYPLQVIPNGIDVDTYKPGLAPIRHLRDDRVNILFLGRLEKRKGLGDLLRAYRFMKTRVPHSRLIVVGDGPLRGSVESYIARHRLPDVVLAGYVPDSVKPRYYDSADIFCAPATGAESFGIVLLEAMASALPVVATEVPGYMSVLEPGLDSIAVRPKSWAELGAALVIVARDEELRRRMGAFGREKARRYAWDRITAKVVEVYDEARDAHRQSQPALSEERDVHHAV
jgi:phosphatidylinositol alpha-mannosyltransferase